MNETDVRAPALVTLDLMRFVPPRACFPEDFQIHVVIPKVADRVPQLARTDPAVEVDHSRCLARRARHGPACRRFEVFELSPVMEGKRSDVSRFLDPLRVS